MHDAMVIMCKGLARMMVAYWTQPFDHATQAVLVALTDYIAAHERK
jgi:hypothetical protein